MVRTLVTLAALLAAGTPAKQARHPDVGATQPADACAACHAEKTPGVVMQWEYGRHGLLLVKCFACHGSTGADFARRPRAARCEGCHPAELASLANARGRSGSGPDCFACHGPHSLAVAEGAKSPHVAR
ncbi:MAG TPA: hypothetical protein VFK90_04225 [Anaeromyxobacter sp.]|nr:hypothetical protein [Anaeromyxobacter sp.]